MDHQSAHHDEPKPAPRPVMDVLPPKTADGPKEPPRDAPAPAEPVADQPAPVRKSMPAAKPAKQPRGVGLAIAATIIIVLGLGALFVYAYLRSNGIVIF